MRPPTQGLHATTPRSCPAAWRCFGVPVRQRPALVAELPVASSSPTGQLGSLPERGRESVLAVTQGITVDTHVIVSRTDTARSEICIAVTNVLACCQPQV